MTLGVDVTRFRQLAFLVCAFATASFVALSGVIGFIGLMVPHLARGLVGPLHGALSRSTPISATGSASTPRARRRLGPGMAPDHRRVSASRKARTEPRALPSDEASGIAARCGRTGRSVRSGILFRT